MYWLQAAAIFEPLGSPYLQLTLKLLGDAQKESGEERFREIVERAQEER